VVRKQQICDIEARLDNLESTPPPEPHRCAIQGIEAKFKELTLAVAEGIESVSRKERRIAATLARARKDLKKLGYENAGLEAEASELNEIDATGSDEQRVPAMREAVGAAIEQASSIRGVPLETLRRYRGLT